MNFQRFLKSSALLGVLASLFLSTSSYGMKDPAGSDDGAHGLTSRTAALSVSDPEEELSSDDAAVFLQKIERLPKIYRSNPTQLSIVLKVKFVPILGIKKDGASLRALFGDTDEGRAKVSQILAEQIAAVKECISTRTLGNLKWLYFVSHSNNSFEPAGYFETQGHESYKLTEGPLRSESKAFFNSQRGAINTFCFEDFHRKIRGKFPLPLVKETHPPYQTMFEAVADKPLIDALVAHFDFHGFQDPTNPSVSYQPSLFGVGRDGDEEAFTSFSNLLKAGVRMNVMDAALVPEMIRSVYKNMVSNQLKVINSFRYRMHAPMNLEGTIFLLRKSTDSCVVGLLKFNENRLQLQMDPDFSRPIADQMLQFFVDGGYLGKGLALRYLVKATKFFFATHGYSQSHLACRR